METFEEWFARVQAAPMREFAGGGYALRSKSADEIREMVMADPELRARAEESWQIETEAKTVAAAIDPRVVRDLKIRFGLVD